MGWGLRSRARRRHQTQTSARSRSSSPRSGRTAPWWRRWLCFWRRQKPAPVQAPVQASTLRSSSQRSRSQSPAVFLAESALSAHHGIAESIPFASLPSIPPPTHPTRSSSNASSKISRGRGGPHSTANSQLSFVTAESRPTSRGISWDVERYLTERTGYVPLEMKPWKSELAILSEPLNPKLKGFPRLVHFIWVAPPGDHQGPVEINFSIHLAISAALVRLPGFKVWLHVTKLKYDGIWVKPLLGHIKIVTHTEKEVYWRRGQVRGCAAFD